MFKIASISTILLIGLVNNSFANPFAVSPSNYSTYPNNGNQYPNNSNYPRQTTNYNQSAYPTAQSAVYQRGTYQQQPTIYMQQGIQPSYLPVNQSVNVIRSGSISLNPNDYPIGRPTLSCIAQIASNQGLPFDLMLGIQSVELGQTGQRVANKNTSYDIGAFQINSIHLGRVRSMGGTEDDLAHRGCYNARIAAILLSESLYQPGKQNFDYYTRAAGYHSWTPVYNQRYRRKLVQRTKQWQDWLKLNQMGHLISAPPAY